MKVKEFLNELNTTNNLNLDNWSETKAVITKDLAIWITAFQDKKNSLEAELTPYLKKTTDELSETMREKLASLDKIEKQITELSIIKNAFDKIKETDLGKDIYEQFSSNELQLFKEYFDELSLPDKNDASFETSQSFFDTGRDSDSTRSSISNKSSELDLEKMKKEINAVNKSITDRIKDFANEVPEQFLNVIKQKIEFIESQREPLFKQIEMIAAFPKDKSENKKLYKMREMYYQKADEIDDFIENSKILIGSFQEEIKDYKERNEVLGKELQIQGGELQGIVNKYSKDVEEVKKENELLKGNKNKTEDKLDEIVKENQRLKEIIENSDTYILADELQKMEDENLALRKELNKTQNGLKEMEEKNNELMHEPKKNESYSLSDKSGNSNKASVKEQHHALTLNYKAKIGTPNKESNNIIRNLKNEVELLTQELSVKEKVVQQKNDQINALSSELNQIKAIEKEREKAEVAALKNDIFEFNVAWSVKNLCHDIILNEMSKERFQKRNKESLEKVSFLEKLGQSIFSSRDYKKNVENFFSEVKKNPQFFPVEFKGLGPEFKKAMLLSAQFSPTELPIPSTPQKHPDVQVAQFQNYYNAYKKLTQRENKFLDKAEKIEANIRNLYYPKNR